jgi:hypothetical protein
MDYRSLRFSFRRPTHAGRDARQRLISSARFVRRAPPVATYKMIYGDEDTVAEETLDDIDSIEHEDGWVVLFRGDDAILRVQEEHVQSLELVTEVI